MAMPLKRQLDAENRKPFINAAPATAAGELVTYEQLNAAVEGMSWKDSARVASTANLTLSAPGATIDAITMVSGDRVLLKNQTTQAENGIYIWNGAATPLTRAPDADTFAELESAIVTVEEGTAGAATTWRQTQVNGVIGTNNVLWTSFIAAAPSASEATAGIAEIATQAETDAGTDDLRIVTPLKMATYAGRAKRLSEDFGDGSATSFVITHNLNTLDCDVVIRENGGSKRQVLAEVQYTSVNTVTIIVDAAPTAAALRAIVTA
jgi:hypothetical protein